MLMKHLVSEQLKKIIYVLEHDSLFHRVGVRRYKDHTTFDYIGLFLLPCLGGSHTVLFPGPWNHWSPFSIFPFPIHKKEKCLWIAFLEEMSRTRTLLLCNTWQNCNFTDTWVIDVISTFPSRVRTPGKYTLCSFLFITTCQHFTECITYNR